MYRNVLVPLDGSPFGEQALPTALGLARRAGAAVQLAHVHVPLVTMYAETIYPMEQVDDAAELERAQAYLDGVARKVAAASPAPVRAVLLQGPVTQALTDHVNKAGVDLIVMTTHGRGPVSRFWLGSVADALVRQARPPILLLRPQEPAPALTAEPVWRHFLLPLDGSATAERILEPAVALGTLLGADYTLLRVVEPIVPLGFEPAGVTLGASTVPPLTELEEGARAYLSQVAGGLQARGLTVRTRLVTDPRPASAILDAAQDLGCDLLALETHGRRGLARVLLGSVADKVVRAAPLPVLIHRPENP